MSNECQTLPEDTAPKPTCNYGDKAPSIRRLLAWFTKNEGYLSPDVGIVHDERSGFHVRATGQLGSPIIVRCPLKLTISHLNLDHSQSVIPHIDSPLQRCLGEIPDKTLTYLLLIEQKCLAEEGKSAWQPYFECLPTKDEMTTTLWFEEKDMEYLEGTDLYQATREKMTELVKEYEDTVAALTRLGIKPERDKLSYELYLWAVTIMSSRSFVSTYMLPELKTFPILFPVIDILNHTTEAKVDWTFQDGSFTVAVVEQESICPGDQIFNNYAPKQNGELLLGYGFAILNNPIEQFAIKLRLPPDLIEVAKELGFYESKNVPFGMPKSLLDGDPNKEQHFLRLRGHVFGRYENEIPWLRGIAPWIVHSAFVAVCMQLGHTPHDIDLYKPAGIAVLQVLLQLHKAVKLKGLLLHPTPRKQTEALSVKHQYAMIYRDGQAKIIHHIRRELEAVITSLRIYNEVPPPNAVIITTTEALMALKAEHLNHHSHFEKALNKIYGINMSHPYAEQVNGHEKDIWTVVIFLFAYLTLTTEHPNGLIHDWVLEWLEVHTLPSVASLTSPATPLTHSQPESDSFDETVLGSFILNSPKPITSLNSIQSAHDQATLDARFSDLPVWDDDDDVGLGRLGDKVLAWATEVVEIYSFPLFDGRDQKGDSAMNRFGMYMRPFRGNDPIEEKWMYQDVDVPEVEG